MGLFHMSGKVEMDTVHRLTSFMFCCLLQGFGAYQEVEGEQVIYRCVHWVLLLGFYHADEFAPMPLHSCRCVVMSQLVVCGVKPSLKGAIFKALAACAADAEFVPKLWNFVELAQVKAGTETEAEVISVFREVRRR